MFYTTDKNDHGLPYDPFKNLIIPRPIGWIGSYAGDGTSNLAPYSFFNAVSSHPPILAIASQGVKDTQRNIETTGAFTHHIVSNRLLNAMNETSAPLGPEKSEFARANLEEVKAESVNAPRIKNAEIAMECQYLETVPLKDINGKTIEYSLILGQVMGIHIDDRLINDKGHVDITGLNVAARLGYMDYASVDNTFTLQRPQE